MKLREALKNLTGLTAACMIQDVENNQVSNFFTDAYKKSKSYETLWGVSPDHVKFARILI